MKKCTKCGFTKAASAFSKDRQKKDGCRSWCKTCHRSYTRRWASKNPDKKRRGAAGWYRKSKEAVLANHRQRLYGVTPADWERMLRKQGGRCAVCGAGKAGGKGNLHIDHDHQTGSVRGLLCHKCNLGLGHFDDDERKLGAAIKYLRKHQKAFKLKSQEGTKHNG